MPNDGAIHEGTFSDSPSLSIIIPIYNAQKDLRRCVESVLTQSRRDFECLLLDDGSTDGSPEICDALAAADERIRVFHKPNTGVSDTRNFGIEAARGDWICFLDADDWLDPELLSKVLEIGEREGSTMVQYGFRRVGEGGRIVFESVCDGLGPLPDLFDANVCLWGIWCKLIRRDFILSSGIRFISDIKYGEDLLFSFMLYLRVASVSYVPLPLYNYFLSPGSVVANPTERHIHDDQKVASMIESLCTKSGRDDFRIYVQNQKIRAKMIYLTSPAYRDFAKWRATFPEVNELAGTMRCSGMMKLYMKAVARSSDRLAFLFFMLLLLKQRARRIVLMVGAK